MEELKQKIERASLYELRVLDVCIKERREKLTSSGSEDASPAESIAVTNIRGRELLYLYKRVQGRTISRSVKEVDIPDLDFEIIKVSPRAKVLLAEKFGIELEK